MRKRTFSLIQLDLRWWLRAGPFRHRQPSSIKGAVAGFRRAPYNSRMHRPCRFLTVLFTVAALVFAQLAVAAYSCPMLASPAVAATADMPCELGQVDNANLCDNHCKNSSASFDSAKSLAASPQAVDTGLRVPSLRDLGSRLQPALSTCITPAASPPFARFTVLRI